MIIFEKHFKRLTALGLIAGSSALAVGALFPTRATALAAQIGATYACVTSAACVTGANGSSGPGVTATSAGGSGLVATSARSYAVTATTSAAGYRAGVIGYDRGTSNSNSGVSGLSTSGSGVTGQSVSGSGVGAFTTSGYGILAQSNTGVGIVEFSGGTGVYAVADGPSGSALQAVANSSTKLLNGTNSVTDQDEVSIDSSGNEVLAGTLTESGQPLVRTSTSSGNTVAAYTSRTSSPTLEDFGEARLSNGAAYVALDASFAAIIDQHAKYMVFLSPQGDNGGLYVSTLSARGFAVKEARGGHSSLLFDYRIVAKPYDSNAARLPLIERLSGLVQGRALLTRVRPALFLH